jgi:hypothetical protein
LEDPIMRSYLIVANQTLTSESLREAITARLADGPLRVHVVVPMSAGAVGSAGMKVSRARRPQRDSTRCSIA